METPAPVMEQAFLRLVLADGLTERGTGTGPDGRFAIPNLAPGSPYSMTVTP